MANDFNISFNFFMIVYFAQLGFLIGFLDDENMTKERFLILIIPLGFLILLYQIYKRLPSSKKKRFKNENSN